MHGARARLPGIKVPGGCASGTKDKGDGAHGLFTEPSMFETIYTIFACCQRILDICIFTGSVIVFGLVREEPERLA